MIRFAVILVGLLVAACHVLMLAEVPCDIGRDEHCPPAHVCAPSADDGGGICLPIVETDGGPTGDGDGDGDGDGGTIDQCPTFEHTVPADVTSTSAVSMRASTSPYDRGPVVFGAVPDGRPTTDLIRIDVGDAVAGSLREHADGAQGTIIGWIQLGIDPDTITSEVALFHVAPWSVRIRPGRKMIISNGIVDAELPDLVDELRDGNEHFFALRWDAKRKLDLNNHLIVHVDAFYRGAIGDSWLPVAPTGSHLLGGSPSCANGITSKFSGLTVFRRVLTDGRSGTSLGNDNELGAMRSTDDPLRVTGAFDVLLAVPTDHISTTLSTTGQAWAMPLDDELANADGFTLSTVLADPGQRFAVHPNATVEPLPDEERLFEDGVAFRSSSPVHGLGMWIPVSPGDRIVARVLAHGEGDVEPQLFFISPGFLVESAGPRGQSSSTRERPDELVSTIEIPAGVTDLYITVVDANATGDRVFVHQIEAYSNLIVNPSVEAGATDPACDCYVPTGWNAGAGLIPGSSQLESSAHSGASGVRISGAFSDFPSFGIDLPSSEMVDWDHYAVGAFFRWNSGDAPAVYASNGSFFPPQIRPGSRNNRKINIAPFGSANSSLWTHAHSVARRVLNGQWNNHFDFLHVGGNWDADTDHIIDDVYVVRLRSVALVLTPGATFVDDKIYVSGTDSVVLPLATAEEKGDVSFALAWGNSLSNGDSCQPGQEVLFILRSDENDFITLAGRADRALFLRLRDRDGTRDQTVANAFPVKETFATFRLVWDDDDDRLQITVDGTPVFDVNFRPRGALDQLHPGIGDGAIRRCDVIMSIPVVQ